MLALAIKQGCQFNSFEENFNLGPVVQRPISTNPGLNFNVGSFSFVQKNFVG